MKSKTSTKRKAPGVALKSRVPVFLQQRALPLLAIFKPIVPRRPVRGDSWCTYSIVAVFGGGALRKGAQICIRCPPRQTSCPTILIVSPADGIFYAVKLVTKICTVCSAPRGRTYQ